MCCPDELILSLLSPELSSPNAPLTHLGQVEMAASRDREAGRQADRQTGRQERQVGIQVYMWGGRGRQAGR